MIKFNCKQTYFNSISATNNLVIINMVLLMTIFRLIPENIHTKKDQSKEFHSLKKRFFDGVTLKMLPVVAC